jgi:hypothetical protein
MRIDGSVLIIAAPDEVLEEAAILRILHAVGETADSLLADYAAAVRNHEELSELAERRRRPATTQKSSSPKVSIDPLWSLINQRILLAEKSEDQLMDAAYAFSSWWADVAVCATVAVLTDTPLTVVRVRAADPAANMDDDELALLPAIPPNVQQFAELAVSLDEPLLTGHELNPGMMPVGGLEFAERVGLRIHSMPDGGLTVVAGGWPEARRRRLWGSHWLEHQTPLLPDTANLIRHLTEADVPPTAIHAIGHAAQAVDAAVAARGRAAELHDMMDDLVEKQGDGVSEELAQLDVQARASWAHADQLPHLLGAYARVLTGHLPTLQQLRGSQSADDTV